MPFGISGRAVNQAPLEACNHTFGVFGNESRPVVEEQGVHEAVPFDETVKTMEEKLGAFARSYEHFETEASGIVEEAESNAPKAAYSSAKVFPIAQNHEHAVAILESPHVGLGQPIDTAKGESHPAASSPDGAAADPLIIRENAP